jgi:uncharacterized repeat protein (TIGR02543 family)
MFGGTISNNTAANGGGIYTQIGNFTMFDGAILNNTADAGGGIYLQGGLVELFSGIISGNTASTNGGGIWVALANLDKLYVYDGMIFSNNCASVAYDRNPIHDALYHTHIGSNVVWTVPFIQGYNNYDISCTSGTPFALYTVTVIDSYAQITGAGDYPTGAAVTIDAGTRHGYTFTGWTVNEGDITLPNTPIATFTMPPTDVTVTANWKTIIYNIFYELNGGTNDPANPYAYSVEDLPLFIADPTRAGYVFVGWTVEFTDGQPGITQPIPNYVIPVGTTGDVFLTAHWIRILSTFTVIKQTIPPGSSTVFSFVTSASAEPFTLTDGTSWTSGELLPDVYTVTELPQFGWDLVDIQVAGTSNYIVDLNTGTVTFTLEADQHIFLTYLNVERSVPEFGSFTVGKLTIPSGSSTVFNFVTSAPAETFSLTDGAIWNSGNLPPGNYTVTELVPPGWDLANIIISDPDGGSRVDLATGTVFIDLDPGETITIFYQNTQQAPLMGSFSVSKVTCPVGSSEVFSFVTSAPGGAFTLTDGAMWSSGLLVPGTYVVTELAQAGWDLTNILVNDPTGASFVDLATGTITINLQAGNHVSIVYQNTQTPPQPGSISVIKTACPPGSSAVFTYVTSTSEGTFNLSDREVWNSGAIAPGRYLITEILQTGWMIDDIIVVDPLGTSTVDLATGTATINLQAGSHVTIIFQNTQQPQPGCGKNPCECQNNCNNQPPTVADQRL